MKVETAIEIARANVTKGSMQSSAELCLNDAVTSLERGFDISAFKSALRSLSYSVGIFDSQYIAVQNGYTAFK